MNNLISISKRQKVFVIYCLFLMQFIIVAFGAEAEEDEDLTDYGTDADEPMDNNYEHCRPPYLGTGVAQPIPRSFTRMGPNSKYFVAPEAENLPIRDVATFCEGFNLQPAEIRNILELISIENFLKVHAPEGVVLSIGANDDVREGSFMEYDGSTPMSFHSFAETQPNNKLNMESCIVLSRHPSINRLIYLDSTCDTQVTPMCMFSPDSQCYYSSPLSTVPIGGGFESVGSTSMRDYFIGTKQSPRSIAAAECEKAGYKLIDFSTGKDNNQDIYEMVKNWIERNLIYPRIAFWTGGKLVSGTYQFADTGKDLGDLTNWDSLAWDMNEPTDGSNQGLEDCISAILYYDYSPSNLNLFTLSTTNCRLPHYPICYKEKLLREGSSSEPEIIKSELAGRSSSGRPKKGYIPKTCDVSEGSEVKLNMSTSLSPEELLLLSSLHREGVLSSDTNRIKLSSEKPWLTAFLEAIYLVTTKACPVAIVPPNFINVMHNLMLLYYNGMMDRVGEPDENSLEVIRNGTALLQRCTVSPLEFVYSGDVPEELNGKRVIPIVESVAAAAVGGFDMIIDVLWHSFLTAIGSCYSNSQLISGSKTYWLSNVYRVFADNFVRMFEERWVTSMTASFGVVVGDMDVLSIYYSLRVCSISSFIKSDIGDLYFPRPLYLKQVGRVDLINTNVPV